MIGCPTEQRSSNQEAAVRYCTTRRQECRRCRLESLLHDGGTGFFPRESGYLSTSSKNACALASCEASNLFMACLRTSASFDVFTSWISIGMPAPSGSEARAATARGRPPRGGDAWGPLAWGWGVVRGPPPGVPGWGWGAGGAGRGGGGLGPHPR